MVLSLTHKSYKHLADKTMQMLRVLSWSVKNCFYIDLG